MKERKRETSQKGNKGRDETERRERETTILRQRCDSLWEKEIVNDIISELIGQDHPPIFETVYPCLRFSFPMPLAAVEDISQRPTMQKVHTAYFVYRILQSIFRVQNLVGASMVCTSIVWLYMYSSKDFK